MTLPDADDLRQHPEEWHRRGMLHPDDVAALVRRRLAEPVATDPMYSDFFEPPSRVGAQRRSPATEPSGAQRRGPVTTRDGTS